MRLALFLTAMAISANPVLAGDPEAKGKGKAGTLTGCLGKSTAATTTTGGSAGTAAYTLTTKEKAIDVRGAQLAEHVGHEVKLTGTWMDDATHGAGGTTTQKEQARTEKGAGRHFMVSDVQHIAETCSTRLDTKQQKQGTTKDTQEQKQQDKPQKQY